MFGLRQGRSLAEAWCDRWLAPFGAERISWIGSVTGILGALILAINVPWSGLGWYVFVVSNLAWIAYALLTRVTPMLLMQLVFINTSLIGIIRGSF